MALTVKYYKSGSYQPSWIRP